MLVTKGDDFGQNLVNTSSTRNNFGDIGAALLCPLLLNACYLEEVQREAQTRTQSSLALMRLTYSEASEAHTDIFVAGRDPRSVKLFVVLTEFKFYEG